MARRLPLHNLDQSAAANGQTTVWSDASNAWVPAANGSTAPNRMALLKVPGVLTVSTGTTRLYNDTGATWTLLSIRASVETAPSGGTVVVDVNKNGTTVFTTQANRPTVAAAGTTSGKVTSIDVTTVADGDYLSCDIDTATSPAANLTITIVIA